MKKLSMFLLLALLLGAALPVQARPAYPGKFTYVQPDGSRIVLQRHGDEWGHWITDDSGRVMRQDADGYYRATGEDPAVVAQTASIRRRARRAAASQQANAAPIASGQKHFLIIMVEFKDVAFACSRQDVDNMMNQQGYSSNGATGSGRDYFYENSNSFFEPIFDVYGPVTLENNMSYYGGNDSDGNDLRPEQAVIEGCKALDGQINFSQFDNDKDGYVDLVYMVYAGYGEADYSDPNTIWPHQWELSSAGQSLTLDGKKIDRYACSNEKAGSGSLAGKLDGIGAICHEFGHAMGLPDFYDVDYDYYNGEAGGLYSYSVMCAGSYNNDSRTPPYLNMEERILLGWVSESDAYQTFSKSGSYTLPALKPESNQLTAYKTPTDQDGEYFVYECRGSQGWDKYLLGHGLVVYHVDKSSRKVKIIDGWGSTHYVAASELWSNWHDYNAINENGSHPCFYVVPATSQNSLNYTGNEGNMPFPGNGNVNKYTAKSWNGVEGDYALTGIQYSSNQSTFTVTMASASTGLDYPAIANPGNGVYSKNSSFALELVESSTAGTPASVSWTLDGTSVSGSSVTLSQSGAHIIEATATYSSGRKDVLTLEIVVQ